MTKLIIEGRGYYSDDEWVEEYQEVPYFKISSPHEEVPIIKNLIYIESETKELKIQLDETETLSRLF